MARTNFKKLLDEVKKWNRDAVANEKIKVGRIGKALAYVNKATADLKKHEKAWHPLYKEARISNEGFLPVLEAAAATEETLKKTKNKAEQEKLKKQLQAYEKSVKALEARFDKVYKKLEVEDKALSAVLKPLESIM